MKAPLQTKAFQTKAQAGCVLALRCVSVWATPPVTCATVKDSRLLVAGRLLQDGTQRRRSGKP